MTDNPNTVIHGKVVALTNDEGFRFASGIETRKGRIDFAEKIHEAIHELPNGIYIKINIEAIQDIDKQK